MSPIPPILLILLPALQGWYEMIWSTSAQRSCITERRESKIGVPSRKSFVVPCIPIGAFLCWDGRYPIWQPMMLNMSGQARLCPLMHFWNSGTCCSYLCFVFFFVKVSTHVASPIINEKILCPHRVSLLISFLCIFLCIWFSFWFTVYDA